MRKVFGAVLGAGLLLGACPVWADRPTDLYTTQTKTATTTAAATDAVLWTPAAGKQIALQGCAFSATNAVEGIELEVANVDVIPPFGLLSYGSRTVDGGQTLIYVGAKDAVLTYSVADLTRGTLSVVCWGYEF